MSKIIKNIVTDIDGNAYNGIQIENQFWITENLNVTKYKNGDEIPQVQDINDWSKLTTGAWCYYENKVENGIIYGKLYNWFAINDPRGIAPEGYHIPSNDEWGTLIANLGGEFGAGGKIKEKGTIHWNNPNEKATNQSGFTALPGGLRWSSDNFDYIGESGRFWSSSEYNDLLAIERKLGYNIKSVIIVYSEKRQGSSVRFLKDSEENLTGFTLGKIEVFNNDIGELNYNDAKIACAKLGGGWRLPTKEELNQLFEKKETIGQFTEGFYWSSTNADDMGVGFTWGQRFSDGRPNFADTTSKFKNFVRPVRSI